MRYDSPHNGRYGLYETDSEESQYGETEIPMSHNNIEVEDFLVALHETVLEEWDDPEEFRLMLNVAASDAGVSDDTLGEVGNPSQGAE